MPSAANKSSYERFAAALAHEVRTPLAVTLMYIGFIEEELGARVDEKLRDGLAGARNEIARLEQLMGKLVEHARLGHLLVEPRLVDGGQVVADAVRRGLAGPFQAEVVMHVGADDLVDWWDPSALEQIVHSLLSNAVRFGEGRPVSISVDRADRSLCLRVQDRGNGIPARMLAHAFSRRVPREHQPGLGLGLWLVRELARAHGGNATVEAEAGAGSTFVVTLDPRPPCEPEAASESDGPPLADVGIE